jgi:hypothetical protein
VVRQMKGFSIMSTIAEIARKDESVRVRRKAQELIAGWTNAPAPAVGVAS